MRFVYDDTRDVITDTRTGNEYHTWYEDNLLELLNDLNREVYILGEYNFYDDTKILMVSNDYREIKNVFDDIVENMHCGHGVFIRCYELNKFKGASIPIDWIIKERNGKMRNIMEE